MAQRRIVGEGGRCAERSFPAAPLASAFVAPALALPQGSGDGNPIVSLIFLFLFIVLPLLRGLFEKAAENRREHEKRDGQRRRRQAASGEKPKRRDPFERLRRAIEEQARQMEEAQEARRPAPGRPGPPPSRRDTASSEADIEEWIGDEDARDARSLTGDPFDESSLERDLHERRGKSKRPSVRAPEAETTPPEPGPDSALRAALSSRAARKSRTPRRSGPPDAALRRVANRVPTPWAQAIVYEELLGPPLALREPR